jgi:hypothetical protein
MTRAKDISKILTDADISGTLDVSGAFTSQGIDDNADATAITIDSSERVMIGTTTEGEASADDLTVASSGNTGITIRAGTSNSSSIYMSDATTGTGEYAGYIAYSHAANTMSIGTGSAQRISIGSNILIGTTDNSPAEGTNVGVRIGTNGTSQFSSSGDAGLQVNRTSSDGQCMRFYRDGTQEGEISVVANSGNGAVIIGHNNTCLLINDTGAPRMAPSDTNGGTIDNATSLGWSNRRFSVVYAGNGSINTSDKNEKQDIESLSDAEKRVAVVAKSLIKKYRWKDAVTKKGDDARIHIGIIAQDLEDAFKAEGLDASRYGMFCSDTWWEKEITVDAVKAKDAVYEEVTDSDGKTTKNLVSHAIEAQDAYTYIDDKQEATEGYTERTRLGVRYSELLAFIISAI